MDQYLDGMVDFVEWLVDTGVMRDNTLAAMTMAAFCDDKFRGTAYDEYVTRYLNR